LISFESKYRILLNEKIKKKSFNFYNMKSQGFKSLVVGICLMTIGQANAQFDFSGQYMSRGEMRHGYSSLADASQKPSIFISQRARINGVFTKEKYKLNFAIQDVRTWGSVSNLSIDNKGFLSVYEANAELYLTKKIELKVGRQILSYDDDRIFGSLDWAMQGRRHDAALFKYQDSSWTLHTGIAYNQNSESSKYSQYNVAGNYKSLQFLWLNKKTKNTNTSFLFLNNGTAYNMLNGTTGDIDSVTINSQTAGLRNVYTKGNLSTLTYVYYQFGKDTKNNDLSAYDICLEASYKPSKSFLITLGVEMLSGTSQIDTANTVNNSFTPFYGTNHRFNGYMDYFYVGNHMNSVGLIDGYLRIKYAKNKMIYSLNGHYFNAAADVKDLSAANLVNRDPHLGAEIDFTCIYNFTDGVSFQGGYSQIFGTETLKTIKGGSISANSNWAYLMLLVRPSIKAPKTGLKM
jgi:hypothetical protein